MYNDLLVTCVNITFMFSIFPQIIKNFKVKNTATHSLLYHVITCLGFILLMYVYYDMAMMLAVFTITFNLSMRIIFSLQIIYYNKGNVTLW
jgi:uncharacterized protein with PQ loop repeat